MNLVIIEEIVKNIINSLRRKKYVSFKTNMTKLNPNEHLVIKTILRMTDDDRQPLYDIFVEYSFKYNDEIIYNNSQEERIDASMLDIINEEKIDNNVPKESSVPILDINNKSKKDEIIEEQKEIELGAEKRPLEEEEDNEKEKRIKIDCTLDNQKDEIGDGICRVCFQRESETLVEPCGHVVCCANCSNKLSRDPINERKCIVCRQRIDKITYFTEFPHKIVEF